MHAAPPKPAVLWLLLSLLALAPVGGVAQTVSTLSLEEEQALAAEQARRQVTDRILASGGVPLEGAVDPAEYIVGPGDVFSISIGGAVPLQLTSMVTADGALVLPEVGSFDVTGRTLAEARARVETALRRAYRNVSTNASLAQPRQFYVHVSGEVERPGRHVAVPVARVEDALAAAMEGGSPLQAFEQQRQQYWNYAALPALRNVEVHRGEERLVIDLMRYYATGDPAFNPYLRDGDRLYVPSFQSEGEAVFVERDDRDAINRSTAGGGARPSVALFDYRPDDTVTTLLLVAGGPELLGRTDAVRLVRTQPDGSLDARRIDVRGIRAGREPDVPLQPRDRLLLLHPLVRGGAAEADGLVEYPGTYPIVVGETTLRDLVEAAGGIRPDGLLRAAYLERREPLKPENPSEAIAAITNPADRAARIEQAIGEQARLTDLPFTNRQYLTRELLRYQRVALQLGDDPASVPAVPLRDGDRFIVPRDPGAVLVVGQVRSPGYVPYRAGADAAYYIEQAGGRGPNAAETYLREASTGALRSPEGAPVRSGDALFVDRPPIADTESLQALAIQEQQFEFQQRRESADRRFQYIQTGLAVLGTAISTYLLFTR